MDRSGLRRAPRTARCRSAKPTEQWAYGDVDAGLRSRPISSSTRPSARSSTSHQPLETRSGDGLLAERQAASALLHAERGADRGRRGALGRHRAVDRSSLISEYTGGGFGSKIRRRGLDGHPGAAREEGRRAGDDAHQPRRGALHRPRPHRHAGRVRIGFRKDGRVTALDLFVAAGRRSLRAIRATSMRRRPCASLVYQPTAMRFRGLSVLTNTPPPTSAARARAAMQAERASWSRCSPRRRGSWASIRWRCVASTRPRARPVSARPAKDGKRSYVTSAFVRDAIDRGRRAVQLGRRARRAAGQRRRHQGARRRRRGQPVHRRLLDRLRRPDDDPARRQALRAVGRRQSRHALGHRHGARRRRRAGHAVGQGRGRLGRHQQEPAVDVHVGRQPDHARDVAVESRRRRWTRSGSCWRLPRRMLGGRPEDYALGGERVHRVGNPGAGLTYAQAAHARRSRSAAGTTVTSCRPTSMR